MENQDNAITAHERDEQKNIAAFKEEAYERLAELESALLELEKSPTDQDLIGQAFRAMHTIKGSGGMFGFDDIVAFTHHIETVFDRIRAGEIQISRDLIALTLNAHDQLKEMLEVTKEDTLKSSEIRQAITQRFAEYLSHEDSGAPSRKNTPLLQPMRPLGISTYRIRFKPHKTIFSNGTNPILLLNELQDLGDCKIVALTTAIPDLDHINPEFCYTSWDIILNTGESINAIQDVFIFVSDNSDVLIDHIDMDNGLNEMGDYKKIGEILVDRGDISSTDLANVLQAQAPIGEKLTLAGMICQDKVKSALVEQVMVKQTLERRQHTEIVSSIRVASAKLDKLVDLVGELVTTQARLSQIANANEDASVLSIAEELERLTTELRDNTMSVRMVVFGTTFGKFKRLIRDLSSELKKDVDFITEGADTELDKNVIEQLNDPLVHLLRNAVDHGIETPAVRRAAGKPPQGVIRLSALHSGAHVLIRISDDGAGLDAEAIRAKAIARGIISSDTRLSEKETYFLIFEPGFSLAEEVTNVSGRGVGMDVVKKAIEGLRGSIDISSRKGQGSTITLRLPLTLAIIDGLLVTIGSDHFVIPLAAVEECIELSQADIDNSHGRHITNVRGQIVPYIRLRDQFAINGCRPNIEQVVITEIEGDRIGFVVDHVIGQHQTVIKNLSRVYKNIESISGATIMADGTVALIIDINKHLHQIERKTQNAFSL